MEVNKLKKRSHELEKRYHELGIRRSKYGGCTEITFPAKGYFYLHRTDRWWLVDPEGNAFLSLGINHIESHRVLHDYNRLFWAQEFGIDPSADQEAFYPGLQKKVKRDLALLGMNTLGCHTDHKWYRERFVPYVKQVRFVHICHYMTYGREELPDVFEPAYRDYCREVVEREVKPCKDDPWLLGYSMTDCPVFTELEAAPRINNIYGGHRDALPTWPNVLRNLPGDRAGKKSYMEYIIKRYDNDFEAFNRVYRTPYRTFDEISKRADWRVASDPLNREETEDNLGFLYLIVDKAYGEHVRAIREVDPNHIIMGDKLNGNSDTPDEIVRQAGRHFDLIFFQYYAFWKDQKTLLDRWTRLVPDKPYFMGDSSVNTPSRHIPDPYGPHCNSQELRAERAEELLVNSFSRPEFIGWSWCGWIDQWHVGESPVFKQHGGLQDPFGHFHRPMLETFSHFSSLMYQIAQGI